MKKSLLFTVAAATIVAGSSLPVQAKTGDCLNGLATSNNKIISFECIDAKDYLQNLFPNLGIYFEGGIWNHCRILILPGMSCPNTGNNNPDINVPETITSDASQTETNISENSTTNVCDTETNITETTTSNVCETITSVPEITKPNINDTTTSVPETTKSNTNEIATSASETTKPNTNETTTKVPVIIKPGNQKPNHGESATEQKTTSSVSTEGLSYAEQVVKLVNIERRKAGLKDVVLDQQIAKAAQIRAREIETSFSHTRPNGSSFSSALKEQGITFRGAGENIAWGQLSPEQVMNGWMNSEGHRANILNPNFTKIGVGYYQNSAGRKFWTQLFTYE